MGGRLVHDQRRWTGQPPKPARLPAVSNPCDAPGNTLMRRALLVCGGVLLALVAEIFLGTGPSWYTYEENTRIIGLALVGWRAMAAAGAAWCLAHGFVRSSLAP